VFGRTKAMVCGSMCQHYRTHMFTWYIWNRLSWLQSQRASVIAYPMTSGRPRYVDSCVAGYTGSAQAEVIDMG
jgi:hypothetical protein